jgi:hypothetical protein
MFVLGDSFAKDFDPVSALKRARFELKSSECVTENIISARVFSAQLISTPTADGVKIRRLNPAASDGVLRLIH